MRKIALACASLAALLLVAVLGLGFYGQNSSAQTKNDLAEETNIAQELTQVKASAEQEKSDKIAQLAQQQLDQLPQTSRNLATENADISVSLKDSLTSASNELLETAFTTDDVQLRTFLFDSATDLWDEGVAEKVVSDDYPSALADRVETLSVCEPVKDGAEAPESVAQVRESLDQLTYAASLFSARADVDGYSEDETTAVNAVNDEAGLLRNRTSDAFSCAYKVPARKAAYEVDSKDPQATLNSLKSTVKDEVESALADSAVTDEKALTELLVLQKKFA